MKIARALLGLTLTLSAGCSAPTAPPAAAIPQSVIDMAAPQSRDDARARIAETVFDPDDSANYPKTVRKLGRAWERIQSLREAAAFRVLDSGLCDRVESSEISDRSTPGNLVAFVDCANGARFYVSEPSLSSGGQAIPEFPGGKR